MSSIFSRIINREVPAEILFEDEHCVAFPDLNPQAPIHILIVPRQEITGIATVPNVGDHQYLLNAARKVAELLDLTDGYRLVINQGEQAGQSVPHLHVHLLAGRPLTWPPG